MKIEVSELVRYSDAYVFCSVAVRGQMVITDPLLVVEVLSPSTSYSDRIEKLREYQATASIERYVILEQDMIAATVYLKRDDASTDSVLTGDSMLTMPEIEARISLAEVYRDVQLPPERLSRSEPIKLMCGVGLTRSGSRSRALVEQPATPLPGHRLLAGRRCRSDCGRHKRCRPASPAASILMRPPRAKGRPPGRVYRRVSMHPP
jgi:hypothetical protein